MVYKFDDPKIIEYIENAPDEKRPRGNQGGKRRIYKSIIAAFDIETTTIKYQNKDVNFMYSWALQLDEEITILGRRWNEFYKLMDDIKSALHGKTIVVFVHNLKYEFQYLKALPFESDDVIASDPREVIKAFIEPFEFRCSYKLTGLSLEKFTENVKHKKLSGEKFNYNKIRYPWTRINNDEKEYIINDVLGLVEAIKERNNIYGDNLYTMPITLTGYIRRIVKKNMRTYNFKAQNKIKINEDIYKYLAGAFRGGNACANRYYLGEVINNLDHEDISSAYPAQMLYKKYPIADWQEVQNPDMDKLLKYIYLRKRAVLARVRFNGLSLADPVNPAPYIPESKSLTRGKKKVANNRILAAEQLEIYITDIDFKIIYKQYEFESIEVLGMYKNRYGYLPGQLIEIIFDLYKKKTELKYTDEIEYKKSKELLNSIFGLTAQNPAKEKVIYNNKKFYIENKGVEAKIKEFNKNAFLSYAWGVWTSAHCRADLQELIDIVGNDFIYCDTDGVFYLNGEKHKKEVEELREKSEKRAGNLWAADVDGVIHFLGAWERQEKIKSFITAGMKKYAWEDSQGLQIAIAGVHKVHGGAELGNIEAFEEGFIFKDAGGNEAIYYDEAAGAITIDGKEIEITPFIILRPRTFTLGIYQEYKNLLSYPEYYLDYIKDRGHNSREYIFG